LKKVTGDLITELDSLDLTNSSFDFFVEIRKETDNESCDYSIRAIDFLDVIEDESECLLVICPDNEPITIGNEIRSQIARIPESFTLYACYEINLDDGLAKVKIPIEGFKKDLKRSQFVAVCRPNKALQPTPKSGASEL
jgi:hypothetical protein